MLKAVVRRYLLLIGQWKKNGNRELVLLSFERYHVCDVLQQRHKHSKKGVLPEFILITNILLQWQSD